MSTTDEPSCSLPKVEHTVDAPPHCTPGTDKRADAHTDVIYSLGVTSKFLVTGSRDHTIRVWSKADRTLALPSLTAHESSVLSLVVFEELDLICSGDGNGQILLWRLSNGDLMRTINAHNASILSFSLEGRNLASASKDKTAKLWQIVGRSSELIRLKHRHTLTGHEWPILATRIQNPHIITCSSDSVRVWSLEDGSCLDAIPHFSSISDFEILPRSETLQVVCTCTRGQVKIYDLTSKEEVVSLSGHVGVARIVKLIDSPSAPGYRIVSAGYDGTVRIWSLEVHKQQWQCVHILSFSDAILTPFGDGAEAFDVEGEEFLTVKVRAKRVFDMQLYGHIAYVVGEAAEIATFDLDRPEAHHVREDYWCAGAHTRPQS